MQIVEVGRLKIKFRFKGFEDIVMCEDDKMYKEETTGTDGRILMAREIKPLRHQKVRNVWYYLINKQRVSTARLESVCYSVEEKNQFLTLNAWAK